jgi:hypothetical protein
MILLGRADTALRAGPSLAEAQADLDDAIHHFAQTFALLDQTDVEQSVGNARIIAPYYLNALCMAGRDSEARSFLDEFSKRSPTPEILRSEIVGNMVQIYRTECVQHGGQQ